MSKEVKNTEQAKVEDASVKRHREAMEKRCGQVSSMVMDRLGTPPNHLKTVATQVRGPHDSHDGQHDDSHMGLDQAQQLLGVYRVNVFVKDTSQTTSMGAITSARISDSFFVTVRSNTQKGNKGELITDPPISHKYA